MRKTISTFMGLALMTTVSANVAAEQATAVANWQGIVPGVIQTENIIITGKDGVLQVPVGQFLRSEDGDRKSVV